MAEAYGFQDQTLSLFGDAPMFDAFCNVFSAFIAS